MSGLTLLFVAYCFDGANSKIIDPNSVSTVEKQIYSRMTASLHHSYVRVQIHLEL